MKTEDFITKVNSEGVGYALTSYFGPDVELTGPGRTALASLRKRASEAVKDQRPTPARPRNGAEEEVAADNTLRLLQGGRSE